MNGLIEIFRSVVGNRDPVFGFVLDFFANRPLNILEIGTTRNLSQDSRPSDGWSTFWFFDYIQKHGGSLDICDINQESLFVVKNQIAPNFKTASYRLFNTPGVGLISDKYDLIYLDGGDDEREMFDELNKVNLSKQIVLCDDFHTKGYLAKQKFPNHLLIKWPQNGHEMAVYNKDFNSGVLFFNKIQPE